ncbi:transglutaminase-like domain-containing protein [Planctomycetes bacterium K23_9]
MQNQNSEVRYRIEHKTSYAYSEPVAVCQNQVRMMPAPRPNLTCHFTRLDILPLPDSSEEHQDYFGNRVLTFAIESTHQSLEIVAHSDVTVHAPTVTLIGPPTNTVGPGKSNISDVGQPWELIAQQIQSADTFDAMIDQQRFDSPRIRRVQPFADYAFKSFTPGRGILEAALDFTRRIYTDFRYDTSATNVDTLPEEAFAARAGVCQDFAQFAIACLRSIGLSAKYVSGYLRTLPPVGAPRLIGADESHAWFSIYSGPRHGWVGFDPTNGTVAGTDHIPISIGRDYGDISPMCGVVLGGGQTTLKVSVDVQPIAMQQQQAMQQ